MTRFTITGSFDADDIDDAIQRLATHFTALSLDITTPIYEAFPGPHEFIVEPEAVSPDARAEAS